MQMTNRILLRKSFLMMQLSGEFSIVKGSSVSRDPQQSHFSIFTEFLRRFDADEDNEKIMRKCLRYCCCLMPNPFGRRSSPFFTSCFFPFLGKKIHSLRVRMQIRISFFAAAVIVILLFVCSVSFKKRSFGKVLGGGNFFMEQSGRDPVLND